MTRGRLIVLGLLVLLSALWKIVPGQTASTKDRRADPTAQPTDFLRSHPVAVQCGPCHVEQYKAWSGSFHAQSLTTEGFLRTFPQYLEFLGTQAEENPQAAMACFNCHAPLLKNADRKVIHQVAEWVRTKQTSKLEGFEVGCVACHADGKRAFSGPIENPKDNPFHASNFSTSYREPSFCSTCHRWTSSSVPCSDVYSDWQKSKAAEQGQTCQSCHMPEQSGIAGAGGPLRKIQSHTFPGGRSAALLQQAVALELKAAFRKNRLEVTAMVRNLVPHRVPDG
jgi:formate-dependent nitrite reductase cytochrome c552 subunit